MVNTIKQHQEMGYDRSVGMFSPDGLLLQVEYAEKAVKLGSSILAIVGKDGIVFIGDRKITSKLLIKESFKKIAEVDSRVLIGGAGVMSDGRRLIEQSQFIAQDNRSRYQNPIDILSLVKDIANIQQYYSQSGGLRPFGVSLLIGGIENSEGVLYQTTPAGMFMRFHARCVGNVSDRVNEILEEDYREGMGCDDCLKLGMKTYKKVLEADFDTERFDVVMINKENEIRRLDSSEIKKFS